LSTKNRIDSPVDSVYSLLSRARFGTTALKYQPNLLTFAIWLTTIVPESTYQVRMRKQEEPPLGTYIKPVKASLKDLTADALLIGLSAALLWHFTNIWRYGEYLIAEPNVFIRILETAGLVLILIFGVGRYIGDLKRKRG